MKHPPLHVVNKMTKKKFTRLAQNHSNSSWVSTDEDMIGTFLANVVLPSSITIHAPDGEFDSADAPPPDHITVYYDHFAAGLRFPVPDFVCQVSHVFRVALFQLSPLSIRTIIGYLLLCRHYACEPDIDFFFYCYLLKFQKGSYSLSARNGARFLYSAKSKIPGWKNKFFYLSSTQPWSFLTTLSDNPPDLPKITRPWPRQETYNSQIALWNKRPVEVISITNSEPALAFAGLSPRDLDFSKARFDKLLFPDSPVKENVLSSPLPHDPPLYRIVEVPVLSMMEPFVDFPKKKRRVSARKASKSLSGDLLPLPASLKRSEPESSNAQEVSPSPAKRSKQEAPAKATRGYLHCQDVAKFPTFLSKLVLAADKKTTDKTSTGEKVAQIAHHYLKMLPLLDSISEVCMTDDDPSELRKKVDELTENHKKQTILISKTQDQVDDLQRDLEIAQAALELKDIEMASMKSELEKTLDRYQADLAKLKATGQEREKTVFQNGVERGRRTFLKSDVGQKFLEVYRTELLASFQHSTAFLKLVGQGATLFFKYVVKKVEEQLRAASIDLQLNVAEYKKTLPPFDFWNGDLSQSPDATWWDKCAARAVVSAGLSSEIDLPPTDHQDPDIAPATTSTIPPIPKKSI